MEREREREEADVLIPWQSPESRRPFLRVRISAAHRADFRPVY